MKANSGQSISVLLILQVTLKDSLNILNMEYSAKFEKRIY